MAAEKPVRDCTSCAFLDDKPSDLSSPCQDCFMHNKWKAPSVSRRVVVDHRPVLCDFCGAGAGGLHADHCPSRFQNVATKAKPVASTGGSSSYYAIPEGASDLQDLIEQKEMSFARGNLFKALFRMGEKDGIDVGYDLNKLQWFLDRMKKMHSKGQRL